MDKKIIISLCVVTMMAVGLVVNANTENVSLNISSNLVGNQYSMRKQEVNKDINRVTALLNNQGRIGTDENGESVEPEIQKATYSSNNVSLYTDGTFKVYGINTDDIVNSYYNSGAFYNIISEDFSLNIPVLNRGEIVSVIEKRKIRGADKLDLSCIEDDQEKQEIIKYAEKNEGKYVTSLTGLYMPLEAVKLFSDIDSVDNLISSMNIDNTTEVKYVSLPDIGTEIIYIRTDENEYAIPYGSCSDITGLDNGTLYDMPLFIEILSRI